ncbi:MAG: ABC transporter ATP-binding protein [Alphaproteobacteria bacterium]
MSEAVPALRLTGVRRTFQQGDRRLDVLRDVHLTLRAGEMVALVGPSGAGKSTLLHVAGLLERPDGGSIHIEGVDASDLGDAERTRLRRHKLGFVYQFHHLLPEFTAEENVVLPQLVAGLSKAEARERARELLAMVGLAERASHRPGMLSGGEQQRVAIVRAVANAPAVLLADEPTGNLDPATAERVFGQLMALVRQAGLAALVATHNLDLASRMDRALTISDGRLVPAMG